MAWHGTNKKKIKKTLSSTHSAESHSSLQRSSAHCPFPIASVSTYLDVELSAISRFPRGFHQRKPRSSFARMGITMCHSMSPVSDSCVLGARRPINSTIICLGEVVDLHQTDKKERRKVAPSGLFVKCMYPTCDFRMLLPKGPK